MVKTDSESTNSQEGEMLRMAHLNIEIKARLREAGPVREELSRRGARFAGVDHQRDTYFRVPSGRLKLREGNIENSLIFYERPNLGGPKRSDVHLCEMSPRPAETGKPRQSTVRDVLSAGLGVFQVVEKRREIYFVGNVKFHIDEVVQLGSFLEIEAIDMDGSGDTAALQNQCEEYMRVLGVEAADLEPRSYSDLAAR